MTVKCCLIILEKFGLEWQVQQLVVVVDRARIHKLYECKEINLQRANDRPTLVLPNPSRIISQNPEILRKYLKNKFPNVHMRSVFTQPLGVEQVSDCSTMSCPIGDRDSRECSLK